MEHTEPSANARIFSFPRRSLRMLVTALVSCTALLSFSIYSSLFSDGRPDLLLFFVAVVFFGWIGAIHLRRLRVLDDRVAIDESGICYLPARGPNCWIAWDDIGSIKSHKIMWFLEVIDGRRSRRIRLEYNLDNFSGLRQLMSEHSVRAK